MSNLFQMKTQTLTLSHLSGLDANEPLSLPPVRKHDTLLCEELEANNSTGVCPSSG